MRSFRFLMAILAMFLAEMNTCWSELLFESRCTNTDQWQVLDLNGDGSVTIAEDPTVPVGYGPNVFDLRGGEVFLFAQGIHFQEGTILVLWKDHEPLSLDADGVITFQADYADDLSEAHNLKQRRHHFWIEQDGDDGFQLKEQVDKENTKTWVDRAGIGLTQDGWNRSGWMWQKLTIEKGILRAKFWSSVVPEPTEWPIEVPKWESKPGRAGLKLFSGKASVAYFAISNEDLSPKPPLVELCVTPTLCYNAELLLANLFLNLPEVIPRAVLELTCRQEGTAERLLFKEENDLPAGSVERSFGGIDAAIKFSDLPKEGKIECVATLRKSDQSVFGMASRTIELRSAAAIEEKSLAARTKAFGVIQSASDDEDVVVLEAHSALAHLGLLDERLQQGKAAEAEKSLAYAEEALNQDVSFIHYTIVDQHLSAVSFVMGETYEASIKIRKQDTALKEPLKAVLSLMDDLRVMTPLSVVETIQPDAWKDGTVTLSCRFRLPEEFPAGRTIPITLPAIREGYHRLCISLQNEKGEPVWLDCEKPVGTDYRGGHELARVFVTQNRRELLQVNYNSHPGADDANIETVVRNCSSESFSGPLILRLLTPSGTLIWTGVVTAQMAAGETKPIKTLVNSHGWYGDLVLKADLYQRDSLETCAEIPLKITSGHPWVVKASRGKKVEQDDGEYLTVIQVMVEGSQDQNGPADIEIRHNDKTIAKGQLESIPGETVIPVKATMGTYLVVVTIRDDRGQTATTEIPLIAHVFENREGALYLNGEPFIVKGVNVHGMISDSPERNRHMMRFLKDIGFNMLRGDYPPVWEVDMAEEENLGWMVLAPFSVNSTDFYMKRYEPHPFAQMREVTRRFIRAYRDKPAAWLWNSCNEITNEIEDFLVTLYPLYKHMDPAQRPVVYANLYGQDKALGQDLMAVNYYFGIPQSATDRQPLIERSLAEAHKAGIPCIFTEFNCWYGPVYSKGIEAIRGIYEFGVRKGYSGGFLYLLPEDPTRHPAVVATRENLWTNPSYIAALHHAFDDAAVEYTGRSSESVTLAVRNVRPYWLRKVRYRVEEGGRFIAAGQLMDISPQSSVNIVLTTASGTGDRFLEVDLEFETHQGLKSHVVKQVMVRK